MIKTKKEEAKEPAVPMSARVKSEVIAWFWVILAFLLINGTAYPISQLAVSPSLLNIFREYADDLGYSAPSTGDLSPWTERGVLLLNRVLTVAPRKPGAHRGKGWEAVTEQAIRALAARGTPLVAILWGRDARNLAPLLGDIPRIESAHPSPMSAQNGFFGSRPFSRANQLLERQGAAPVDWKLP